MMTNPSASAGRETGDVADPTADSGGQLRQLVVSLGTNVTVLTGLLVYFGWKRADVQAEQLGIEESILGQSTTDYLLRSVGSLFVPLAVVAFAGLGWLWADQRIRRRLAAEPSWPALDHTTRVLAFAWLWLPAVIYGLGTLWTRIGIFGFPLSIGAGVLLSVYAQHLRGKLAEADSPPGPQRGWQMAMTKTFVGLVVVLSLFWTVTNYATFRGVRLAQGILNNVHEQPSVVVYSPTRLAIDAPGVTEERLAGSGPATDSPATESQPAEPTPTAYRFRYRGLRLLDYIDNRVFLISDGFTRDYGVVVVLEDRKQLRFEYVHDRR